MPEPVTVWAVRLGTGTSERKGTLSLDDAHLSFKPDRGAETAEIPLSGIHRVKRGVGSPVLLVEFDVEEGQGRMAFFFAQPPPIDPTKAGFRRVKERRENLGRFLAQNTSRRSLVREWRRALQAAVRAARR